jgi:hypothetical protein
VHKLNKVSLAVLVDPCQFNVPAGRPGSEFWREAIFFILQLASYPFGSASQASLVRKCERAVVRRCQLSPRRIRRSLCLHSLKRTDTRITVFVARGKPLSRLVIVRAVRRHQRRRGNSGPGCGRIDSRSLGERADWPLTPILAKLIFGRQCIAAQTVVCDSVG